MDQFHKAMLAKPFGVETLTTASAETLGYLLCRSAPRLMASVIGKGNFKVSVAGFLAASISERTV